MKPFLLALLPVLLGVTLPEGHPFILRASGAADDLEKAILAEGVDLADRSTWSRRLFVWSYYESAFTTAALGDAGKACGVMQVVTPQKIIDGATCDAVRKDRVLGYRVGLRLMRTLIEKCGSVEGGLSAYATNGACKMGVQLVRRRMKLAGDL